MYQPLNTHLPIGTISAPGLVSLVLGSWLPSSQSLWASHFFYSNSESQSTEPLNQRGRSERPPDGGDFCRDESVMSSQREKDGKMREGKAQRWKQPMKIKLVGSS